MTYLIFTEKKDNLHRMVDTYFEAFTILDAKGFWQGVAEDSAVILVVSDEPERVKNLCHVIKVVNKQEAVLLVSLNNEDELI